MKKTEISFELVRALTTKDKKYQLHPELFQDFISYLPSLDGLAEAIEDRSKRTDINRSLLTKVLKKQYAHTIHPAQEQAIEKLESDNGFTVITAHQPVLLTGPMYYISKILSTINLCQQLRALHPEDDFIPVFINGAEDHDFEEINHTNFFGHRIDWDRPSGGAVGRLDLAGISEVLGQFFEKLGTSPKAEYLQEIFQQAYDRATDYQTFVANYLNAMFGSYGVLVLSMDDPELKRHFIPVMEKELFSRPSEGLITAQQDRLEALGLKPQAFAREINLFYLTENSRERIIFQEGIFHINNTELSFSEHEMKEELHRYPDRFSPNVIIRPLYQEFILPNIAYIGGGGELAYWLERKTQFEHFGIFFPVLIRRNSLMLLTKGNCKVLDKLGLEIKELFQDEDALIQSFLAKNTSVELNIDKEMEMLLKPFESLTEKAHGIDVTLVPYIESERVKLEKVLEQIEGRLIRSLKKQEETRVQQISNLKQKLFPNHGLQERSDNFFQYWIHEEENLIDSLIPELDPLNRSFLVFRLD